jgi:REP element-mobilizing transposase RayT
MNNNHQNADGVKPRHNRRSIRLKGYDYSQAGAYFITACCQDRKHRFGNIENSKMILNDFGAIAYSEWLQLEVRYLNFELDVFQIMPNHMHAIVVLNNVGAGLAPAPTLNLNSNFNPDLNNDVIQNGRLNGFDGDNSAVVGAGASPAPTVGDIVGAYKSIVANACLDIFKFGWGNDGNVGGGGGINVGAGVNVNTGAGGNNNVGAGGNNNVGAGGNNNVGAGGNNNVGAGGNNNVGAGGNNNVGAGVNPAPYMGKIWQRNYYEHIIRDEKSYNNISNYIINNPAKWAEDKFFG